MPIAEFPDPNTDSSPEGIVGIGGDLHPESLALAYGQGIFPWPVHVEDNAEPVLAWFCPPQRAVLQFSKLHVSRSLLKAKRRAQDDGMRFSVDTAFSMIIRACASVPRHNTEGGVESTWITPEMIEAYEEFHKLGYAHSFELWDAGGELVGGLYGVAVNGVFAGESMFHRVNNASKLCILYAADYLSARGASFMDIQVMTPHMERLGANDISRSQFLSLLRAEQNLKLELF